MKLIWKGDTLNIPLHSPMYISLIIAGGCGETGSPNVFLDYINNGENEFTSLIIRSIETVSSSVTCSASPFEKIRYNITHVFPNGGS